MNLLPDTCTLLWAWGQPEKLSRRLQGLLRDPHSEVWASAASAWELATKHRAGKLPHGDTFSPSGTSASHGMGFASWPSHSAMRCGPAPYPDRIGIRSTA